MAETGEHRSWRGMIERCKNPKHVGYKYYGARGIKVCERWRKSFAAFLEDMGPKPSPRYTIDRYPDQSGDYSPDNCRWATPAEQRANQRPYDEGARVLKSWSTGKRSRVSHARSDMAGQRFGRLVVLSYADSIDRRARWLCKCACGTEKIILGKSLRAGLTKSCGCAQFDGIRQAARERTSEEQRTRALKRWHNHKG